MKNLLESILPAQLLNIAVSEWNGRHLTLTAPLAPNLNDKGTAFAGSIDSLLDLSAWGAITLALRDSGITADVMIVKSETEYTAAVRSDMIASSEISVDDIERLVRELEERGRSRISIASQLSAENKKCAAMTAHYAIFKR